TLSGNGVEVLDAANGRYRVSVTAGASTLALQANALANDGNNIVNAVTLKVNEVIYQANGQSDSGRLLTQVDCVIDNKLPTYLTKQATRMRKLNGAEPLPL
ncbi:MAG: hypothetical protein P8166_18300, partial [Candidatus Thiodiazotropha sp.]